MIWIQTIPPAVCYFLYNWQFFRCVESILEIQPTSKRNIIITFLMNYSIFILCTLFNLHLIANWIIFLFLLLADQRVLYRQSFRKCALFALLGTQLGLALNILCRSLFAIVLNIPLIAFDNQVSSIGNMKRYPVLLGFFAAGILFLLITRLDLLRRLTLILEDQKTLTFLLGLLIVMYFYLCANLMIYYIPENITILKLWSMKSALFVLAGECLSVIFSIRLGQLSIYRAKSLETQEKLAKEHLRELELHTIAVTDPLTGCENRHEVLPRLNDALKSGREFSLGFVDLNGLKPVNDIYGHDMGDKYIQTVSDALGKICGQDDFLFRYGGDEFLLLFRTSVPAAIQRLRQAQQLIDSEHEQNAYPFAMSISYGMSSPEDSKDADILIKLADDRMYQMKQTNRLQT